VAWKKTLIGADGRIIVDAYIRLWDPQTRLKQGVEVNGEIVKRDLQAATLQTFTSKDACEAGRAEIPVVWPKATIEVQFERTQTFNEIATALYVASAVKNPILADAEIWQ
jgi:hypothetical protein